MVKYCRHVTAWQDTQIAFHALCLQAYPLHIPFISLPCVSVQIDFMFLSTRLVASNEQPSTNV
jgi:hypothetical protein